MREYNDRSFCDYFDKPFPVGCGGTDFNLPPMTIDDSSIPNKRAHYTSDLLPADIYVASEKYIITLAAPYDSSQVILPSSDAPSTDHIVMRDKPIHSTYKRVSLFRRH